MTKQTKSQAKFRKSLEVLEINQAEAARLLNVSARTARHWANGTRNVPGPAESFLDYLMLVNISGKVALEILHRN